MVGHPLMTFRKDRPSMCFPEKVGALNRNERLGGKN